MTLLRDYQQKAIDEILFHFSKGTKKVLLYLATGAGKSVIFCEILKRAYNKNKKCIFLVKGRALVTQASERLKREGVPHGILMSGFKHHEHKINICSIDTMRSRRLRPDADLIVIDEAHLAVSKSYIDFCSQYPNAYFLPVTATPFADKPLRHCAEIIVNPISMRELTEQGYLVPGRYFAPQEPDLSDVRIDSKSKDYNLRDLGREMDKLSLTGNLVEHWKSYGEMRPTICFAVSVAHSKHICDQFNQNGIPAVHCDANSPDEYREHCLKRLECGEIKVLTNVGLFGIGVDMPYVSCLILARPTRSLMLYIQQVGRGLRPYQNKLDCLVFDHSGNVLRHGFPTSALEPNLDGAKKRRTVSGIKTCKKCFAVFQGMKCPYCPGATTDGGGPREVTQKDGSLVEMSEPAPKKNKILEDVRQWKLIAKTNGFKPGWVWYQIKNKYGEHAANFYSQ